MIAARSESGTNRALKSSPDIAATLRACIGWQPRCEPPLMSPHEVSTRRRICLRAPVQYPSSAAVATAAPGPLLGRLDPREPGGRGVNPDGHRPREQRQHDEKEQRGESGSSSCDHLTFAAAGCGAASRRARTKSSPRSVSSSHTF